MVNTPARESALVHPSAPATVAPLHPFQFVAAGALGAAVGAWIPDQSGMAVRVADLLSDSVLPDLHRSAVSPCSGAGDGDPERVSTLRASRRDEEAVF